MRALLIVAVVLGLFLAAGAAVFLSASAKRSASAELAEAERAASPPGVAAAPDVRPDARIEALQRSMDALAMQVSQLGAEVQALRGESARAPALPAGSAEPEELRADPRSLSASEIEEVRDVLAEEFQRQADERAAQRAEREREAAERRADDIAKRLSLSAKDAGRLAEVLVAENQKRRELFESIQDSGFDREQMRATFGELQTWKKDELTKTFGTALADQIAELDQPRRGRFGDARGDFRDWAGGRPERGGGQE